MKVVIDTNVLWVSISNRSASHWIFQAILNKNLTLCVTTDILDEYAEIIEQKLGFEAADAVLRIIDNLPNVLRITRYYQWSAIKADPDDDKFFDCAVAAEATCIVSEDNHFKVIKKLAFPKVLALKIREFEIFYKEFKNN